jgi:CBS domain containing-hemolysin-like protein
MVLLILYLSLAIGVSFLCSLLEAGLLSIPRGYVAILVDRGDAAGKLLQQMKNKIDRPLSAILTLNTVAHTVGAAGVGAQAVAVFGQAWVGLVSAALTLLILVFSEIIPKTLGAVHAKRLAGFTAHTVRLMMVLCLPIVAGLEWVNRMVAGDKRSGGNISRQEVSALASLSQQHGDLEPSESQVIRNLIALREIEVRQIMTPRHVVFALEQDMTVTEAVASSGPLHFTRIPIYADDIDRITGLVTRYEINEAYRSAKRNAPLKQLARPMHIIPEHASVGDALEQFLKQQTHLFQVVDEYGGTAGVVSLEDTIETLLGVEIVDETDMHIDMQALAKQVHQRQTQHARRQAGTTTDNEDSATSFNG